MIHKSTSEWPTIILSNIKFNMQYAANAEQISCTETKMNLSSSGNLFIAPLLGAKDKLSGNPERTGRTDRIESEGWVLQH